ncbi:GNAT family N-acetyltransferase [Halorussus salinisoli]|uniref:GNAT family N-acetyltransferase n=1 Tax=Halorussus salinisoli TaxID=2558242 RepID=UPI0010C1CFBD|nr:GNAT family N-acetyltransferase [Halorussus salinisoli]
MATARVIREEELDELLTLYQMLNPDDPVLEGNEALRDQWRDVMCDESLVIVVVQHDERLVSSCVLLITKNLTRNARPFAVIENVVTHEEYRQHGFAKRCLQKATEIAENRDCYKIMLLTGSDKEWKHDFYENCGFDKEEKTGFVLDLRE